MEIEEKVEIRNNNFSVDAVRSHNVHIFSAYIQVIAIRSSISNHIYLPLFFFFYQ